MSVTFNNPITMIIANKLIISVFYNNFTPVSVQCEGILLRLGVKNKFKNQIRYRETVTKSKPTNRGVIENCLTFCLLVSQVGRF